MKISASVLSLFFINAVAKGDKIRSNPRRAEDFNLDQVEKKLEAMEEVVDKLLKQTKKDDVKERFGLPSFGPSPSEICLNGVTSIMNTALDPIESFYDALDPIELASGVEYTLLDSQLPGGCDGDATVSLDLGTISGLSSTMVDVNLLPGGTCNVWNQSFAATWEITKTTNLYVNSSAELTAAACGLNAGTQATGTISIPGVTFGATISIEGERSGLQVKLNDMSLDDINIEVPTVDIEFLANSPLGDFELSQSYEDLISEALMNTVGNSIESAFNGMVDNVLPISIP